MRNVRVSEYLSKVHIYEVEEIVNMLLKPLQGQEPFLSVRVGKL